MRAKRASICEICEFHFEALCFNEDAELNDPVFAPLLQSIKIQFYKNDE